MKKNAQSELRRTNDLLHKATATAGTALERINRAQKPAKKAGKKTARKRNAAQVKQMAETARSQSMRAANKRGGLVGSPYHDYLSTLSRPFDVSNVFCPVSYNPAPSFIQTRSRTTRTELSMTVGLNTTTQLVLFPGHIPMIGSLAGAGIVATGIPANMDPSSFHQFNILANATYYSVGPISTVIAGGTRAPVIGTKTTSCGPGLSFYNTGAVATCTGLTYDVALPYTGSEAVGHSRWQLVSMGIRVQNITNSLYRGGTIVTVQPNVECTWADNDPQANFEKYPTFHDWGRAKGFELSWIPRTQDLAFWHTVDTPTASSHRPDNKGPGMIIWFNAPADYPQTYSYEIVANWQLAGSYLDSVGGPAPHFPGLKGPVEQSVSAMLNSSPSASMAKEIGTAALSATGLTTTNLASGLAGMAASAIKTSIAGFA